MNKRAKQNLERAADIQSAADGREQSLDHSFEKSLQGKQTMMLRRKV